MNQRRSKSRDEHRKHERDPYVKQSREQGYRGRAAFKLIELNHKYHFMKPGQRVLDLGAAPGSWSQVASTCVGSKGQVIAVDILPMDTIKGVEIITGDMTDPDVIEQVIASTAPNTIDVILSDMAPNLSGVKSIDQPRSMALVEIALDVALEILSQDGRFLVKVFQGEGIDPFIKTCRKHFERVLMRKPDASKPSSRELYILCLGRK